MASGTLLIQVTAARQSSPIEDVNLIVTGDGFSKVMTSDENGNSATITVPTPACSYSLDEDNDTVLPYARVTVVASKENYRTQTVEGVQIFPDQLTVVPIELITSAGEVEEIPDQPTEIPTHALFNGTGGSGPSPIDDCTDSNGDDGNGDGGDNGDDGNGSGGDSDDNDDGGVEVLNQVVVPTRITVHLGKPAASATNVTVSFQDYIANVASSEVYPTWPEQALRANIHAQVSLALNRIYTEWYPSKGYTYNITNSTSYDQYFVYKRTIFDVMTKLTADIFNTYVRKTGTVNPYYTEYCDGKSVTCPGMKQWGTVDRANAGLNALQILKYYYGSNIEIVRTSNIRSIPESYPGSPLREGSTGTNVYMLQRQLNRITKDYPSFGTLTVDGVFGPAMTATVRRFQRQFGLTADGVVGRATWYKISYIYVSVKDLAELTSEGETADGTLSDGTWGGTTLRVGSSGTAVEQAQYWLSTLALYYSSLPSITVDGSYGTATQAAVRAFQEEFGLSVDGVVGPNTWNAIYREFQSVQSDIGTPNRYPGTPVRQGDTGNFVRAIQFWLKIARGTYSSLSNITVDGSYGPATTAAVRAFQSYFGLTVDGIVGQATWNKLYEVYNAIANQLLSSSLRPGDFPGTLRLGSTGTAVRELQYYLYLVAAFEPSVPTVTIDGTFGDATRASVLAYQRLMGLTADGIVGQATWTSLYNTASRLRQSAPVFTIERLNYPGSPLEQSDTGEAVLYFSTLIDRIAYYFYSVQSAGITSTFTPALTTAVMSFQTLEGLPATGIVNEATWLAAEALSLTLLANAEPSDTLAVSDEYPGYAARVGSAGPHVKQIQQWINRIGALYCEDDFVDETGIFTGEEATRVQKVQAEFGLSPNGTVDRDTWNALRAKASGLT